MDAHVQNRPLTLPSNMRFTDANNDFVSQLYTIIDAPVLPDPTNSFLPLVASQVSLVKDQIVSINTILGAYNTRIATLESTVAAIQASGATAIPTVNGGCLNASVAAPMQDIMALLVTNSCNYNTVLGTPSALALSILAQCSNLAAASSYSNPSATMGALTGWSTSPTTIANTLNNIWLAYCDARAGITQALTQSAITCNDIKLNIGGLVSTSNGAVTGVEVYFSNSIVPDGFVDDGSYVYVTDSVGNQSNTTYIDLTIFSGGGGSVAVTFAGTSVLQNSNYIIKLFPRLSYPASSLICESFYTATVFNITPSCPNISTWVAGQTISFSLQPLITSNIVYTVDCLDISSGTTSGGTLVGTFSYTNPTTGQTDTFSSLTIGKTYRIRTSVNISGSITTCPYITQTIT